MRIDPDRYRMLKTLDVEAARPEFVALVGEPIMEPGKGCPILAALHKARVKAGRSFTSEERAVSRAWLNANGYLDPAADDVASGREGED